MRLPSQREPSRSLLGRPRCGGSLGRCENEGLQPRPGRQKAYRQTDRQGSWDSAGAGASRGDAGRRFRGASGSQADRWPTASTAWAKGKRGALGEKRPSVARTSAFCQLPSPASSRSRRTRPPSRIVTLPRACHTATVSTSSWPCCTSPRRGTRANNEIQGCRERGSRGQQLNRKAESYGEVTEREAGQELHGGTAEGSARAHTHTHTRLHTPCTQAHTRLHTQYTQAHTRLHTPYTQAHTRLHTPYTHRHTHA